MPSIRFLLYPTLPAEPLLGIQLERQSDDVLQANKDLPTHTVIRLNVMYPEL